MRCIDLFINEEIGTSESSVCVSQVFETIHSTQLNFFHIQQTPFSESDPALLSDKLEEATNDRKDKYKMIEILTLSNADLKKVFSDCKKVLEKR
jgi:hypothetical protein